MEIAGIILILSIIAAVGYRIAKKADEFVERGGFLIETPHEEEE